MIIVKIEYDKSTNGRGAVFKSTAVYTTGNRNCFKGNIAETDKLLPRFIGWAAGEYAADCHICGALSVVISILGCFI